MFAIKIDRVKLPRHRYYNCDVECAICGRPLKDRWKAKVVIWRGKNEAGEDVFLPLKENADFSRDPVEWGNWVGNHCAKLLPREYKMGMKTACKNVEW
jgi:hypothetical protein